MSDLELTNTGKTAEILKTLKDKRSELLTIIEEKDQLNKKVKPKIIYEYELLFGKLEDELTERKQIAEIYEDEISELIVKIKRGEKISNSILQSKISKIKNRISNINQERKETDYKFFDDKYEGIIPKEDYNSDNELNKIFRVLVKAMHPDTAKSSGFESHWDSVIDAYKGKDLNKLKVYHSLINKENLDKDYSFNEISKLEQELIQIQRCIDYERRLFDRLESQEPFCFRDLLHNKEWQIERERLIRSKIIETNKLIKMIRRILKDLTEGRITEIEDDSEIQFQKDFKDNSYFKY